MAKLIEANGDIIDIRVIEVGEPRPSDYGESRQIKVVCNGQEYIHYIKPKNYGLFTVDKILTATRKSLRKDGKIIEYFDFYEARPNTQVLTREDLPPQARRVEVNLQGRGATYNLAFHFCLKHFVKFDNMGQFLDKVKETANAIVVAQEEWVNNPTVANLPF
jgi:hypothetical protein